MRFLLDSFTGWGCIQGVMKHRITLHSADFNEAWICHLSRWQVSRLDNGHLISVGLILGEDVQPSTLKRWLANGTAKAVDPETVKWGPW